MGLKPIFDSFYHFPSLIRLLLMKFVDNVDKIGDIIN